MNQFWPKHYPSQLIFSTESNATVAVVTGWTKKEDVWKNISDESKSRVAIMGQLYSKEGINFIIRNIFLNPNINFLIIAGRDLSGSLKELKSFLDGEKKEFFHEEISQEKIKEFRDYFSKHSVVTESAKIDEVLQKLEYSSLPKKWIKKSVDFDNHLIQSAKTFSSEKVGFRIEGEKVADVWLKVLDRILYFGYEKMSQYEEKQRELIDIVTVINNEDPDNPYLPKYFYFNKQDLASYYPQLMTDGIFEGVEYTYGSRLRNYNGINQIEEIIIELKKESYSRRAIAFTWNVSKDCKNIKSPCLDLVQALVQEDILYLTAYFRSNDMYRAWPQNAYGLLKIQKEISEALGLRMGKLVIISCSAHIYERDFIEAKETLNKNKPKLECTVDPRGNFVIEVKDSEIIVKHIDHNGVFLQEFKGVSARELRDLISRFVMDTTHAIYLGTELARAEYALNNKKEYYQG
jgi:thymidylate synthase